MLLLPEMLSDERKSPTSTSTSHDATRSKSALHPWGGPWTFRRQLQFGYWGSGGHLASSQNKSRPDGTQVAGMAFDIEMRPQVIQHPGCSAQWPIPVVSSQHFSPQMCKLHWTNRTTLNSSEKLLRNKKLLGCLQKLP